MAKTADKEHLNERARHLLKRLVHYYIQEGQPVGSRTLSRMLDRELSPATIRNVMADLEDMGLIVAPHTSAGRIPTARGYRLFVDTLLQIQPLEKAEISRLREQLTHDLNEQHMLTQASNLLSEITHLAGLVMLPRYNAQVLRHVEFLPLAQQRVLVVLVLNQQEVQNRVIQTSRDYSESELQQVANYLNDAFAGQDLNDARNNLLREVQDTREHLDQLMQMAVEMAEKAFAAEQDKDGDLLIAGQTNLMDIAELSDIQKLRELFSAFNQKQDILHLFDQVLDARGVQLFIGEESGYQSFGDCSLVTAPYQLDGEVLGVLGVIGPTRMPYERVIPIVDLTAKLVSSALRPH